jgi:Holliday junction DNA helicase RuvA
MIGKLRGLIDGATEDSVIIDANGVGYLVFCSAKTLSKLPQSGQAAALLIETHVREDHIHLYGFANEAERQWFRLLTTVQGVGVKMALAILGVFEPEEIATVIGAQDKKSLTAVSGVGPKLAERIVTELKNAVAKMPAGNVADFAASQQKKGAAQKTLPASLQEDAVSALAHLGYSRMEAFTAVSRALNQVPEAKLDQLITTALRELAA